MINVKKLLQGNIPDKYNDKIFWYASKVEITDKKVDIYIDNQNIVGFDDVELNIKKISDLIQLEQHNSNNLENVLISSGSFLFINEKLVVTQRDLNTKYDPGYWTTPAGRCDRTIFDTAIKETIEEIEIRDKHNNVLFPKIAEKFISNDSDIKFYPTSFQNKKLPIKTYNINLFLDNVLIETTKAWMLFSNGVNTLEFRVPIFTTIKEENLKFINPEFKTKTGLKTIEELEKLKCVPALAQLLKEMLCNRRKIKHT